jgi:hypothetical protein
MVLSGATARLEKETNPSDESETVMGGCQELGFPWSAERASWMDVLPELSVAVQLTNTFPLLSAATDSLSPGGMEKLIGPDKVLVATNSGAHLMTFIVPPSLNPW